LSQVAAGLVHLAVLLAIQQALDRLAKKLHVDSLSLVNDRSTKTAVVRALLTRGRNEQAGCSPGQLKSQFLCL
jgi:hypothetical protein